MLRTYPIARKDLRGIIKSCLWNAKVPYDSVHALLDDFALNAKHVAFGVSYERPDCRCPLVGAYDVKELDDVPGISNNEGPLITFARLFDMCGYARTGVTFGELVVTDA